MRIDKYKAKIARARSCKGAAELIEASELVQSTFNRAMRGMDIKPDTIGKIARALGVDVLDILADEDVKKYTSTSGKDGDTC